MCKWSSDSIIKKGINIEKAMRERACYDLQILINLPIWFYNEIFYFILKPNIYDRISNVDIPRLLDLTKVWA